MAEQSISLENVLDNYIEESYEHVVLDSDNLLSHTIPYLPS